MTFGLIIAAIWISSGIWALWVDWTHSFDEVSVSDLLMIILFGSLIGPFYLPSSIPKKLDSPIWRRK